MQIMVVVFWWSSMFAAVFAYSVYMVFKHGPEVTDDLGVMAYAVALVGAVIGQLALFGFAHLLESKGPPPLGGLAKYDSER
jgi:hypothetical protein